MTTATSTHVYYDQSSMPFISQCLSWLKGFDPTKISKIEDKANQKMKYRELNLEYFGDFIRELHKTTNAAGCHIMAVGFEEIVKEIIEASCVRS